MQPMKVGGGCGGRVEVSVFECINLRVRGVAFVCLCTLVCLCLCVFVLVYACVSVCVFVLVLVYLVCISCTFV